MKNWGFRIVLIYTVFVIGILTMVALAMHQKIELVSEDYYAKELKFQEQIDRSENGGTVNIAAEIENKKVTLHFPEAFKNRIVKGTVLFFKPSDAARDLLFPILCDTQGIQEIQTDHFMKGMYRMKITFETSDKKYYQEKLIVFN